MPAGLAAGGRGKARGGSAGSFVQITLEVRSRRLLAGPGPREICPDGLSANGDKIKEKGLRFNLNPSTSRFFFKAGRSGGPQLAAASGLLK